MKTDPLIARVTDRIRARSHITRDRYLARTRIALNRPRSADRMACANLAHAWAAMPSSDKFRILAEKPPNLAIISAYNDMLSAHQPYGEYPALIKARARDLGLGCQVASGVPAMCDGITQGMPGMELSLFSRDVIAQATAIGLSHDVFDGALCLGVCDKIVPGLLIGALHFGHLPTVFVPAGPMGSGLPNKEKAEVRKRHAKGEIGRDALLQAEMAAYHSPGTCTFYGTANSNQMLLEAMGLHVPGSAFLAPDSLDRKVATSRAVDSLANLIRLRQSQPERSCIGLMVDERVIVNAMIALLATGGSTNHLIHWVAVARAAGILVDWDDFGILSAGVPLLARVYPNGHADVNDFQKAGGPLLVLRELWKAGLLHGDVATISGASMADVLDGVAPVRAEDHEVIRPPMNPFSPRGGLQILAGNLGRAVIKTSSFPQDRQLIEAPAMVFSTQEGFEQAFRAGRLDRDVVVVVRFQGPKANGMPELHKLSSALSVLQDKGHRVALVTDGRMSGASGAFPAAIHVCPEAAEGGLLARVQDGDLIRLDAVTGRLELLVSEHDAAHRKAAENPHDADASYGQGRGLFGMFRSTVSTAESGACAW